MAASNTVLAAPPPTANILPHSQRSRLLKSSRKIEAMLGTTPLVVPVVDHPPQISPSHATPKLERSKSKAGKGSQPVPQPVLLRSRSVALPSLMPTPTHVKSSSMDTAGNSSGPATPISALFSPITKETNDDDAKEREMKRKKLAKITRTLGENIPPELVFGATYQQESKSSTPKSSGKAHRPRAPSTSYNIVIDTSPDHEEGGLTPTATTSPEFDSVPFPTSQSAPTADTPTASTFYQHRAKAQSHSTLPASSTVHRSRSQRTIAGYYPIYHAGPFVSASPAFDTLSEPSPHLSTHILSASAEEYDGSPLHRAASASATVPSPRNAKSLEVQRSSTFNNFQDFDANQDNSPVEYIWGTRRQKGVREHVEAEDPDERGRKKEREWSGEWNVKDMDDVVKKLRQLKGR
ncbi:hypothetical protein EST38_g9527 [Candolleomyces aberdarensis]|uniref:Uncharacterized protein n=1 Tax=Candolleomyces aberdarensis TaxID=2316362 RepID=A0A4Q2DBF0_9AGAR|nr:hypothetical protein EST38_g9527 [Candolleomyces aberdarensis]